MKKDCSNIENDLHKILTLSLSGCEGNFHIMPFTILYLYAYKELEVTEVSCLEDVTQDIIIYKKINNGNVRVLTTDFNKNTPTDKLISVSVANTFKRLYNKRILGKISVKSAISFKCIFAVRKK